jgi:hypothetical protein
MGVYNGACDPVVGNTIQHGGYAGFVLNARVGSAASGRIVTGHRQELIDRPGIVLRLEEDGTLTVEWKDEPTSFCRTWAWITMKCGA